MGRLTRDPELRHTQSGTPVASFSLAVDRGYVSKDNGERQTDFIDIVAWRATAEFVSKYFTKGQMAAVTGRLQIRDWTDKDGNKRRSAEVIADNVYFTESKRSREAALAAGGAASGGSGSYSESKPSYGSEYSSPVAPSDFAELDEDDGDLPF
jgi:single-strand DNA-binding protein